MENKEENTEEVNAIIEHLLETGAMEVLGFDQHSETFTYKITDKCKEIYPELYEAHFSHVGELAMSLWQKEMIDIVFTDNGPVVGITNEQFDFAKNNLLSLTDDERLFMETIINNYEDGV